MNSEQLSTFDYKGNIMTNNSSPSKPICNICGGNEFKPGWNGRLASTQKNPACVSCGSVERHRISYNVYHVLPKEWFMYAKLLKISDDKSIDTNLFKDVEISIYGGSNSINIENIDRPSETYDWIICNHVLEHVEKDVRAVRELLRILKKSGVFQFMVPSPLRVEKTNDWGYADPKICDHYRTYGKDVASRFSSQLKGYKLFSHIGKDSVTDTDDIIYFVTKNKKVIEFLKNSSSFDAEFVDKGVPTDEKHSEVNSFEHLKEKAEHLKEKGPNVLFSFLLYTQLDFNLTTKTEVATWYNEHDDFVSFREKMIGYPEKDFMNSNLKLVQDLCMYNFIRENIWSGARVLEIGGGSSRILSFFKDEVEGWNLDKCEGIGNGPTNIPEDQGDTFVPAYIGQFDKRLPDNYFDLVFSISVLEHINEGEDVLQKILCDIDRLLKPGGFSVHCIDCRFPPKSSPSISNRKLAEHMILNYGFSPQYIIDNHDNEDVFHMSGKAYDRFWKKACNNRPYEIDGLPFNIFLAVQK